MEQIQIGERPEFQKWYWGVQRVSWVGLAVMVAVALSGMSGAGGPLSRGTSNRGASVVHYPAVMRLDRPETLRIRGVARALVFDHRFLMSFDLGSIVPAPGRQSSVDGALILTFSGAGDALILITATPRRAFAQHFGLTAGGDRHEIAVTVLP